MLIPYENNNMGRLLFDQMYARLAKFAANVIPETNADYVARSYLKRVLMEEDGLLYIFFDANEHGMIVKHAVIEIIPHGPGEWFAYIQQAANEDKKDKDFVGQVISLAEDIGRKHGAGYLFGITKGNLKAYTQKYGFTTSRYIVSKEIG